MRREHSPPESSPEKAFSPPSSELRETGWRRWQESAPKLTSAVANLIMISEARSPRYYQCLNKVKLWPTWLGRLDSEVPNSQRIQTLKDSTIKFSMSIVIFCQSWAADGRHRLKRSRTKHMGRFPIPSKLKIYSSTHSWSGSNPVGSNSKTKLLIIQPPLLCCARGRPIIVEWERDARHSAGLSRSLVNKRRVTKSGVAEPPGDDVAFLVHKSKPQTVGTRLQLMVKVRGTNLALSCNKFTLAASRGTVWDEKVHDGMDEWKFSRAFRPSHEKVLGWVWESPPY
ncbi:hypothetical protein EVAR_63447_1 [Eumeta japonica]|uniref:Uncharacterized protein n=1 Tax=Eumeta variegata TaxID=151549 RepID=A0A4C1YV15_EUMVA|nr:hypothetical protein EVAR_63447_1 [Eumeta japonica]